MYLLMNEGDPLLKRTSALFKQEKEQREGLRKVHMYLPLKYGDMHMS